MAVGAGSVDPFGAAGNVVADAAEVMVRTRTPCAFYFPRCNPFHRSGVVWLFLCLFTLYLTRARFQGSYG
jgi:hypothetical protein